jgi:hypothetical protein
MKTKRKQRREARVDRIVETALPDEPRASTPPAASPAHTAAPRVPSTSVRALISIALLFHLGAGFVAALRVPPVSQLALGTAWAVRWYSDVVLVNPGYRFFAPNPGESHMIRAEIVAADGSRREEIYPDLRRQWPRLLYHRHFMLTSRLADVPADEMSQALVDSYARHLFARDAAREVRIFRRVHLLPTREQVRDGMPLDDTSLYASPYDSPVGTWITEASASREATRLELRIDPKLTASITGRVRGQPVQASWRWQPGPPTGPRRLAFFEHPSDEPACTADSAEEHELVLHYPLPSGVSRIGSVEHVPMRRAPPPLAVYRGEEP